MNAVERKNLRALTWTETGVPNEEAEAFFGEATTILIVNDLAVIGSK